MLAELLEEVTACDPPFCVEIAAELRANRDRLLEALGGEPAYYVQVDFDIQFVETASHVEVDDDLGTSRRSPWWRRPHESPTQVLVRRDGRVEGGTMNAEQTIAAQLLPYPGEGLDVRGAKKIADALRKAGYDLDHRYEQIGWRHYCMAAPGHVILFSPTCGYTDCDGVPVPVFVMPQDRRQSNEH